MKNWLFALFGADDRAIEQTPRACFSRLNYLQIGELRSRHACASRVTALCHEAVEDAVEHNAIIKTFIGQRRNPLNMAGRKIGAELDGNFASIESKSQGFSHVNFLLNSRRL